MSATLRIAYARIAQETHAFSPVPTTIEDFRRFHWKEGRELERACGRFGHEIDGMIRSAELSGFVQAVRRVETPIELVPLFSAWAMPSGPVTEETYAELRDQLVAGLEAAGPLDGLYLALHGAMRARGAVPEAEEGLLAAARGVLGPDRPIAISLDLHGRLSGALVGGADVLVAYRTNPHRDLAGTGRRAGRLLVDTMLGRVRPVAAWRSLPIVLGGGSTVDLLRPMRSVFRLMKRIERDRRVLSVGLFLCHPWNDAPDLGWAVHVLTDGDPDLAERRADELADAAWAVRHEGPPEFLPAPDAIRIARACRVRRRLGTICLSDTSDVVGAGSTGENTRILSALLAEAPDLRSYVPLLDPLRVAELWDRPAGDPVRAEVGGTVDPVLNPPVPVAGRIRGRATTRYFGRAVVLDLGHVQLVLTERPPYPLKPRFYSDVGLDPWRADLVVVKSFFHFRIYFLLVCRKSLLVRTKGLTDLDWIRKVRYDVPVHPIAEVDDWRPADRIRRGEYTRSENGQTARSGRGRKGA